MKLDKDDLLYTIKHGRSASDSTIGVTIDDIYECIR